MRPATAGSIAFVTALVLWLLASARSDPATPVAAASRSGDAPRRVRAIVAVPEGEGEAEEETDEEATDETGEPAGPEADEPEPPRRVIRIVDGRGDPLPGVAVGAGREFTRSTDEAGETSFQALGDSTCVTIFDGAATRQVVLVDPITEVVVASMPALQLSVVDARSGVPLDPVRFRLRRGEGDGAVLWTGRDVPTVAVAEDGAASFKVAIDAPTGYGGYRTNAWRGRLALRARTARLVVPSFEATSRAFRAVDRERAPLRGATAVRAWADARGPLSHWSVELTFEGEPSSADGLLRVDGLPRMPFTRFSLGLRWRGEGVNDSLSGEGRSIDPCGEPTDEPIVVVLNNGGSYRGPAGGMSG